MRTNNKIVPLTNLNKYLYDGKSEIKVKINNSSENVFKKTQRLKKLNERKGTATVMIIVRALLPANLYIQFHELENFVVQNILIFSCMDGLHC